MQDPTVCVFFISAATARLLAPKLKQFTATDSPQETSFPLQSPAVTVTASMCFCSINMSHVSSGDTREHRDTEHPSLCRPGRRDTLGGL